MDEHFPTREMFSPLAAFILRIAPAQEERIRKFRARNFGLFTIGMQVPSSLSLTDLT
jgi:hypothetical protein